jgi:hypothetical protein
MPAEMHVLSATKNLEDSSAGRTMNRAQSVLEEIAQFERE